MPARQRSRALLRAFAQLGEDVVDEAVARIGASLRELEVLLDAQPREHVAVFGHVPDRALDDLVGRQRLNVVAGKRDAPSAADQPEHGANRGRLPRSVAPEQRGDAAVRDSERHTLQNVRLSEVDVDVVERKQGLGEIFGEEGAQSSCPR